jgi:hypothetical protein
MDAAPSMSSPFMSYMITDPRISFVARVLGTKGFAALGPELGGDLPIHPVVVLRFPLRGFRVQVIHIPRLSALRTEDVHVAPC